MPVGILRYKTGKGAVKISFQKNLGLWSLPLECVFQACWLPYLNDGEVVLIDNQGKAGQPCYILNLTQALFSQFVLGVKYLNLPRVKFCTFT